MQYSTSERLNLHQTFSHSKCTAKIKIDSKTTIRQGEKNTEIRRISQIVGNVFRLDPMEIPKT